MLNPCSADFLTAGQRRFKPYPAYKEAGVEWLGGIPTHWHVKRLKYLFHIVNGSTPKSSEPEYWDGNIPWVTPDDLGTLTGVELRETARYITQLGYKSCGTTLVPAGSLVLSTRAPIGHLAVAGVPLCTNQGCRALVFRDRDDCRFFYYQVLAARSELESLGQGSTFRELGTDSLASVCFCVPPLKEQKAIATFLDRETAKIDALVAKKGRLTELLQEKRTTLITRAVTKCLDASVPMKDSGAESLDQLPVHWMGLPLKRWVSIKITDGPHETPELVDEGIQFISAEAVCDGRIDFEKRRGYISPEAHTYYAKKCMPMRDDILLCKSGATTGKLAMVDVDFEFSVWSPLALVRADRSRILPHFLAVALQSDYVQEQIRRTWSAGTQPNIGMGDVERLFVVAPSIAEQKEILSYLDAEIGGFTALIAKIREGIERLKEYRAAVTSAVVTGKIDVREEAA